MQSRAESPSSADTHPDVHALEHGGDLFVDDVELLDPDSEYHKYASRYARESRAQREREAAAGRALLMMRCPLGLLTTMRLHELTDSTRTRGRCEARPSARRSRRSSSRAGPSGDDPPPRPSSRTLAWLSPGVFACPNGGVR
jgi:hypothetical protein